MSTLDYYNHNAEQFYDSTVKVAMESIYAPFLRYLPEHASILDLGCGSGRDSLAFHQMGYQVSAIDYSEVLVKKAQQLTGLPVRQQSFYDLDEVNKYDGVWACASLLHCERQKLPEVLSRILRALKAGGVLYMSFKYGSTDREKDGRNFTDLDEQQAHELLRGVPGFLLLQQWITVDKRPERSEEWLNILLRKV
ncbi:MAG: class I SAM-dependent methyltransferase [Pelistega sp.]|nr:class I SAM-dependent methyltransferase [Pelistega sp.]